MNKQEEFIEIMRGEFPDDRLTFQKAIPTFHPESGEEASRLIKLANDSRQAIFIAGFGNHIDPAGERFASAVSIKTDRLNKLIDINAADLYVAAGGGYPLKELNIHLAAEKLWFPHAALPYVGSLGGALAVGLNAEMHEHDVPIRRYFLKAEIVTPTGDIITPGSVCFKSVSGYDVVKVFSGSWGLLGLIVSATLRVMPETGREDYETMRMQAPDRGKFLEGLPQESIPESELDADQIYSRKIKNKFDPNGVLPVL